MSAESKTRMTEGKISQKIIFFAIPLFLGNLFQQLYNTADSLIVGISWAVMHWRRLVHQVI